MGVVEEKTGVLAMAPPETQVALHAQVKAEIDVQITTAKAYPRSLEKSINSAKTMALYSEDTAQGLQYTLRRGHKPITGHSVRMAEIVACCWGNLRVRDFIKEVGETHVTAGAYAHDLETNYAQESEIRVRITDKHGKRFNEDMINVTANAARAKARRNAILAVVPKMVADEVANAAQSFLNGGKSVDEIRKDLFKFFQGEGVTQKAIMAWLRKTHVGDVTLDDVAILRGVVQSVKEGETTYKKAFAEDEEVAPQPSESIDALNKKMQKAEQPDEAEGGQSEIGETAE